MDEVYDREALAERLSCTPIQALKIMRSMRHFYVGTERAEHVRVTSREVNRWLIEVASSPVGCTGEEESSGSELTQSADEQKAQGPERSTERRPFSLEEKNSQPVPFTRPRRKPRLATGRDESVK